MKIFIDCSLNNINITKKTRFVEYVNRKEDANMIVYIDSNEGKQGIHFSTTPVRNSICISAPKNKTVQLFSKLFTPSPKKEIDTSATTIKNTDLSKFKYCIHEEENISLNHFTHTLAVLNECLVFYKGCPNLETILPPQSFVRYSTQAELVQKVDQAGKEKWWDSRISYIREAKRIILKKYTLESYIDRIIEHELVLKNCFLYRFDFFAKLYYVKYPLSNYAREVYRNHITVFNNGVEHDDGRFEGYSRTKNSVNDFVSSFNHLISSIKENTFDSRYPIPLGKNGIIENGIHRLAVCFNSGILPEYKYLTNESIGYDYKYFSSMNSEYYNTILWEACETKLNLTLITIFPVANPLKEKDYLEKNGHIFSLTSFEVDDTFLFNYVRECYRYEEWASNSGIAGKTSKCKGNNPLKICLYYSNIPLQTIKDTMREIDGTRDSIHIHDNQEQKMRLANMVFHKNTFEFSKSVITNLSPKNTSQLTKYYSKIAPKVNNYAIDSSFIMSMYNLREANDLDYICYDAPVFRDGDLDCHNNHFNIYEKTPIKSLIEDPSNYFYYAGVRVLNLSFVRNMKDRRREGKDYRDLELIDTVFKKQRGVFIVYEGPDCSGKTTHTQETVKYLKANGVNCEIMRFPNRNTSIGKLLDAYLKNQEEYDEQTVALLFAANQREMQKNVENLLNNGVNIICDRYYLSGLVYREGCDENWLTNMGRGLIKPDLTLLFHPLFIVDDKSERYHTREKQDSVWKKFIKLNKNDMIQVLPNTIEIRQTDINQLLNKVLTVRVSELQYL